ncbi:MAG: iron-containing alcohol dehydrogenase [Candidatus Abyssobacteria bacterium SURF_5]|uniref:Iron-containing alcohol dehydrogenase n=1 Tax=Abyssobacteria bacterium (strain SURF_5) TaxID=2093360 RepID=A0A3A4NK56_ABYX5|nr:MAG: iron-containing alcohol dehydrogenase [Candidatus Abyssubacteria bacterium SURF_5]
MKTHPELHFGSHLLESLDYEPRHTVVATMELPWQLASPRLPASPDHVVFVERMEREYLDRVESSLPSFSCIVGIGGGSCMDFAKYLSWKRSSKLILIPSIVSVDACVTHLVAVREGRRVRNVGNAHAAAILIDFTLISAAPKRLNRAGSADILSVHTASFDWKIGYERDAELYSPSLARRGTEIIAKLESSAGDICEVNKTGIRKLVELFEEENDLCLELGNFRPEEGSEHFFAYAAEHVTGKHFVHGELVSLGMILMARLQNNKADWLKGLVDRLGVLYRPSDIGLEARELPEILAALPAYCRDEGLPRTIITEREFSPAIIDSLISDL